MSAEIRFAHLSDWHATTLEGVSPKLIRGKRISGWASWKWKRRHYHRAAILEAAQRDVQSLNVDRILVTGDLTHISLPSEFERAAEQLRDLGTPEDVFLIPGNHDCYVPVPAKDGWDHWAAYLRGDHEADTEIAKLLAPLPKAGEAPRYSDFPTLRVYGQLATIGLCSAIPTPLFRAGGMLGPTQLERLEVLLELLRSRGLCRVLMIHHPVALRGEPERRALWDGEALREVLGRKGAELVLHGHKHRRLVNFVDGPDRPIPVVGVPSSSEVGSQPSKRAQYHVYTVRQAGDGYSISGVARAYDAEREAFGPVEGALPLADHSR